MRCQRKKEDLEGQNSSQALISLLDRRGNSQASNFWLPPSQPVLLILNFNFQQGLLGLGLMTIYTLLFSVLCSRPYFHGRCSLQTNAILVALSDPRTYPATQQQRKHRKKVGVEYDRPHDDKAE